MIPAVVCLLLFVNSCYAGVWKGLHEGDHTVGSRKWFLLATSFRALASGAEE
ncbi:exported hypothetical protein [Candidatus Sulfotelmatobacter sp. SbA7]|nr:exported hypothetical protein [Candidatus Sulfotelmatobacter sp. SbA7]